MSDVKSTTLDAIVLSTAQSDRFRLQVKILASMYIGYGAMMVSRQIVTILSPALLADASLRLTKTNIGDFWPMARLALSWERSYGDPWLTESEAD